MIREVKSDFIFDLRLEKQEQQAELCLDPDFTFAHSDLAVDTNAFKIDVIAAPSIVDFKLARQVAGEFIRRGMGFLAVHCVTGAHIYVGHSAASLVAPDGSCQPENVLT